MTEKWVIKQATKIANRDEPIGLGRACSFVRAVAAEARNEAIDEMCEAAIQATDGEIQRQIAVQLGVGTVEMKEIGRIRAEAARLKEQG